MSYEINVIVIKQKEPVHIANLSKILLQNETENIGVKRYAELSSDIRKQGKSQ